MPCYRNQAELAGPTTQSKTLSWHYPLCKASCLLDVLKSSSYNKERNPIYRNSLCSAGTKVSKQKLKLSPPRKPADFPHNWDVYFPGFPLKFPASISSWMLKTDRPVTLANRPHAYTAPHFYSSTEQEQQSCCQEAQTTALAPAPQCRDTHRQQGQDYCSDQQLSGAGAILLSCLRFPYCAWCNLMLKKQMLFNSPPSSDGQR